MRFMKKLLKIFICEDNEILLKDFAKTIEEYLLFQDYPMEICLYTKNPNDIIHYLENNKDTTGIYFLDVELGCAMDGFELGSEIRKIDELGRIIYITSHDEMALFPYQYKLEVMDFIVKNNINEVRKKMLECLDYINEKLSDKPSHEAIFKYSIDSTKKYIEIKDILFFETSTIPHKIRIHADNLQSEFYGKLKDVEKYHKDFIKVHRSIVVNKANIENIDFKKRTIVFRNGQKIIASSRLIHSLK